MTMTSVWKCDQWGIPIHACCYRCWTGPARATWEQARQDAARHNEERHG